jgi:diguanylate cyclase
MVESFSDVSDEQELRERASTLEELALIDPPSGTANRRFAHWTLAQWWAGWESNSTPFGALLIEIDNLSDVRRSAGTLAADYLVRALAGTLMSAMRGHDFLARWHDSQFLALLSCPGELTESSERVLEWGSRLAIPWQGRMLRPVLSAGAVAAVEADSPEELIQMTEERLEEAHESRLEHQAA